mgnify:CR=1 FL=1
MSKIDKDKIIEGLEAVRKVYPDVFGTSSSDKILKQQEKSRESVKAAQAEIDKLRKEGE